MSRIAAFREYSMFFIESGEDHNCIVQTWDDHTLMSVCVRVESVGQRVPEAELAGFSRVLDGTSSCQMPLCCQGFSPTLLRVLSDNRVDGREFVVYREFSVEVFLHCYQLAHQEVFGGLETTAMIDFLMLRIRGAVQEPWCEGVPCLRRCIVAGRVAFADLCDVVTDLIAVWTSVQDFVKHTVPRHFKTGAGRVIHVCLIFFCCFVVFLLSLFCVVIVCVAKLIYFELHSYLQMRGTDWHIYSESTSELRLGLLLHVLDLCEYSFLILGLYRQSVVVCCLLGGSVKGIRQYCVRYDLGIVF